MNNKFKLFLLPIILLGLTGCLEHRYFITTLPSDRVKIHFELRGDRADIEDGNELLPDSILWGLTRTVEETEDETTHIYIGERVLEHSRDLASSMKWGRTPDDSVHFTPAVSLESQSFPFCRVWTLKGIFSSRRFIELYGDMWEYVPEECRVLQDSEASESLSADETLILERKFGLGIIQWTRARYERSFDAIWTSARLRPELLKDTTVASMAIIRTGWVADLHAYLNNFDVGDPQTTNLNWWKDVRQMLLGRFVEVAEVSRIEELGRIADAVENTYLISKDMEDDKFVVEATLPGRIIKTNGLKNDGKVSWEIAGKDFQNETLYLKSLSIEPEWPQIAIGIVAFVVIIWVIKRRRGSN